MGIQSTEHYESRLLFFPANCVTWLYSTLFSYKNMDDSDNEFQVTHRVSFLNVASYYDNRVGIPYRLPRLPISLHEGP